MTRINDLIESFEESFEVELPKEWVVCPSCQGRGVTSLHGIALTEEDFAEDPDFRDDYFSGVYDSPCPECNGRTTVQEVVLDQLQTELIEEWRAWVESDYETEAIYAMERRMGA